MHINKKDTTLTKVRTGVEEDLIETYLHLKLSVMIQIYASKLRLNNVKVVSNSQEQRNVQLKRKYTICPLISRHIAVH